MKKEIKDFLEFNVYKGTAYPHVWEIGKAVLRRKFIALSAHIKNLEKFHNSDLTEQLKCLE